MDEMATSLAAVRASTAAMLSGVDGQRWSDADVHAPSLLPGWTRAHVLTHVARNADGIGDTLDGALRGEIVLRYPNGPEGRNRDIEAGAGRGLDALLDDLRTSARRLDGLLAAVEDAHAWDAPTEFDQPASHWLTARRREVEIHRVDLAGDYRASDWPADFIAVELPEVLDGLAGRTDAALHIRVSASDSPALAGRGWDVGGGADPVLVSGPDWALLAWALGRPQAVAGALSAEPDLSRWR